MKYVGTIHKQYLMILLILVVLGVFIATAVYLSTSWTRYGFTDYQYGSGEYKSRYFFESPEELKTLVCNDTGSLFEGRFTRCEIIRINSDMDYLFVEYSAGDDSVAATRTVYRLETGDRGWAITGIESKLRCHTGRGNTEWHSGKCI